MKPPTPQHGASGGPPPAPQLRPPLTAHPRGLRRSPRRRSVPSAGPRLPPLLATLTRRPEDDARLRCLRAHNEQRQETPRAPPPAFGVRLLRRPELMEDAVRLCLQPPLYPDGLVQLLGTDSKGRPLHADAAMEAEAVLQRSPQSANTVTEAKAVLQQSPQSANTMTDAKAVLQQSPQSSNTVTEAKTVLQQSPQSSNTKTEAKAALQQSPQSSNTVTKAKTVLQQSPQSSNIATEAEVVLQRSPQSTNTATETKEVLQKRSQSSNTMTEAEAALQQSPQSANTVTEAEAMLQQSPQSSNTATEAKAALQQSSQSSNTATETKAALQQSPQSSNTVTEAEVEALRELYDHLGPALPPQRLCFDAEPLLEPAATDRALTGGASRRWQRGARNTTTIQPWEARNTATTPRRQARTVALLQEYRQFLEATGSDFLHAIFQLSGGDDGDEEAPGEHPGVTAEPPPPPVTPKPTPTPTPEELQRRLHRLWAALRVPVREQVAMATKYGPATARRRLAAALELWDEAAALIRRRERLLALLEGLELRASDPNRFFHRGARALAARLGEARARDRLNAAAERCQGALRTALRRLREEFGDAVTLRGRSYEEKARRDRGEMLYRLQQARRAAAMGNIVRPAPGAQR